MEDFLPDEVRGLLVSAGESALSPWSIELDYHFGGYAKSTPKLREWNLEFSKLSGIPLEPVYSGKLFFAVHDMIEKQKFASGSRILIVHTGGIN